MFYLILIIALLISANVAYRMIVCTFSKKEDDLIFPMILATFVWWIVFTWSRL